MGVVGCSTVDETQFVLAPRSLVVLVEELNAVRSCRWFGSNEDAPAIVGQ